MFTDDDTHHAPTIGTTTPAVDIFVILMTFFILQGLTQTLIHEDGFTPTIAAVEREDTAATVIVGPRETIRLDDHACDLNTLHDTLARLPADATVALHVQTPVEYDLAYRVRLAIRSTGLSVQELPPGPSDR